MSDILPTIILIGIVYALYRWLTGPKTPSDPLRHVRRDMVMAVTSVFPNIPLDAVVYSLSRTRSQQTTLEIILERGSLPSPPAGFVVPDSLRPIPVPISSGSASGPSSSSAATSSAPITKQQSLIERYGLGSKEAPDTSSGKWEASREDREKELRSRKERMILEARKRMMEKEKQRTQV